MGGWWQGYGRLQLGCPLQQVGGYGKEEYNRVVLYKWQRRISATQQLEASANSRATTPLYGQPTLRHPGKE